MILAVTGHRPDSLGGYSTATRDRLAEFARQQLAGLTPSHVLTGMALGWDTAIAAACVEFSIPFTACIPCDDQEKFWRPDDRARYAQLLAAAAKVEHVPGGPYAGWKMQGRNCHMVDNCEKLLALWNGRSGGTGNCVRYAYRKRPNLPMENCWDAWQSFLGASEANNLLSSVGEWVNVDGSTGPCEHPEFDHNRFCVKCLRSLESVMKAKGQPTHG